MQLALWCFYDGQYAEAVEAAKAAHAVWVSEPHTCLPLLDARLATILGLPPLRCLPLQVKEMGQDSQAATFHGIRLGMALAGGWA